MLWFALFSHFLSWTLATPVLAAIFHLLRLGQAATSTTVLASLLTTKCREVFLQARSKGGTVTMVSLRPSPACSLGIIPARESPGAAWGLSGCGGLACFPFLVLQPSDRCWLDSLRAGSPWYGSC